MQGNCAFCYGESQETDENLKQNIPFPKDGYLSCLKDVVVVPGEQSFGEGGDAGEGASRGLRFL